MLDSGLRSASRRSLNVPVFGAGWAGGAAVAGAQVLMIQNTTAAAQWNMEAPRSGSGMRPPVYHVRTLVHLKRPRAVTPEWRPVVLDHGCLSRSHPADHERGGAGGDRRADGDALLAGERAAVHRGFHIGPELPVAKVENDRRCQTGDADVG